MANQDKKQEKLPKLKRTDSSTIDPRMPCTQENFINTINVEVRPLKHDESLKRKREDNVDTDKGQPEPEVKKKKD